MVVHPSQVLQVVQLLQDGTDRLYLPAHVESEEEPPADVTGAELHRYLLPCVRRSRWSAQSDLQRVTHEHVPDQTVRVDEGDPSAPRPLAAPVLTANHTQKQQNWQVHHHSIIIQHDCFGSGWGSAQAPCWQIDFRF